MRVYPSWDMGEVFYIAESLAKGNNITTNYLYYYPNNIFITLIYTVVFKISLMLNITDLILSATVFNSLIVSLTAVFTYLSANQLYKKEASLMLIIILLLTTPLYLQSPIYYTDSASMFCVSIILFCIIKMTKAKTKLSSIVLQVLTGILIFISFGIKVTSFILIIALAIYTFYKDINIKKIVFCIASFIIFLMIFTVSKSFILDKGLTDKYKYPPEHWIMMGINGIGGFSIDDCEYTSSFDSYAQKKQAARKKIIERLEQHNAFTFSKHLNNKLMYIWNDGTYFAPEKLKRAPLNKGFLHECILFDGKYTNYYKYFPQGMHYCMIFFIICAALCQKKNKPKTIEFAFILSILGLTVFLLIWEARSRYLLTMFPIMALLEIYGIEFAHKRLIFKPKERSENIA